MSVEGLYTVAVHVPGPPASWRSGGIAVLERRMIFGGDSIFYCIGKYEVHGMDTVKATVRCRVYAESSSTIWGDSAREFDLDIAVDRDPQSGDFTGYMQRPDLGMQLKIRLTIQEDLS